MSLSYKKEIDGLRAFAVIMVVLYHLRFPALSGGFVGVDVFFVISGYLITRKIHSNVQRKAFIFSEFYLARVRRILPALLATILLSFLAALALFSPVALTAFSKEGLSAIFSASNFLFYFQNGYFDVGAYSKPLLHTWSLSVEEQYYLVWPPIFLALCSVRKFKLHTVLAVVAAVGLVISELCVRMDSSMAYYMMPFRAFEFAIGAFLAVLPYHSASTEHHVVNIPAAFLTVLGISLILFCVLNYDEATKFPGVNALWPSLGGALCILGGQNCVSKVFFMNKIAVRIGKISYSLYLVHWPITVFTEYMRQGEIDIKVAVMILVCSIIGANLLYEIVESPFRGRRHNPAIYSDRLLLVFSSLSMALLSLIFFHAGWKDKGWSWRLGQRSQVVEKKHGGNHCSPQGCESQKDSNRAKVYVFGDSHARALYTGLKRIIPEINFAIYAPSSCPFYIVNHRLAPKSTPIKNCDEIRENAFAELKKSPAPVIITQRWMTRQKQEFSRIEGSAESLVIENTEAYVAFVNSELGKLKSIMMNYQIILIGGVPQFDAPISPVDCVTRPFISSDCVYTALTKKMLRAHRTINEEFAKLRDKNFVFIDPFDYFCDSRKCRNFDENGRVLYSDSHHLSTNGSLFLIEKIRHIITEELGFGLKKSSRSGKANPAIRAHGNFINL